MRERVLGYCRICGTYGKLSFEHCPPASAFNEDPILLASLEKLRSGGHPDDYDQGGRIQQRGAGAHTLCDPCNTRTGGWYGSAYVKLARQAMEYLQVSRAAGVFHLPLKIKPLNVIKQVVCMFMSANGPKFHSFQPELARFVLNRETRHLPSHVRLFAFYSIGDRSRFSGVSGVLQGFGSTSPASYIFSEFTFPPLGFVMTFKSPPPDDRLTNISYWADEFTYNEKRTIWPRLPVLPIYTFYPGDYRDREKVLKDGQQNLTDMKKNR